jgi:hypothetical protein
VVELEPEVEPVLDPVEPEPPAVVEPEPVVALAPELVPSNTVALPPHARRRPHKMPANRWACIR